MPDDIISLEDGVPALENPLPEVTLPPKTLDDVHHLVDYVRAMVTAHKKESRIRYQLQFVLGLCVFALVITMGLIQSFVVTPRLTQAAADIKSAQADLSQTVTELNDAKQLTRVLMDSLAANNRALSKTMDKKLTTLGFEGVPK